MSRRDATEAQLRDELRAAAVKIAQLEDMLRALE
jgi:hypothetical protein